MSDLTKEKHFESDNKVDVLAVPDGIEGEVALERNFSYLSSLGLAFALLNSWTAMSASLSLVLPSGGSVSMIWGLVVSALGTLAMGASLAEICHIYPMTGGQYDWACE
jgi:amino acid transporter